MNIEKCPITIDVQQKGILKQITQEFCGNDAFTLCLMPIEKNGRQELEFFKLCPFHALELAVGKIPYRIKKWKTFDVIFLIEKGCTIFDLIESRYFPSTLSLKEEQRYRKSRKFIEKVQFQCSNARKHAHFAKFEEDSEKQKEENPNRVTLLDLFELIEGFAE